MLATPPKALCRQDRVDLRLADQHRRRDDRSRRVRARLALGLGGAGVTKANLDKVPARYIRKQTIANGERYFTPALKEMESKILGAEERSTS